ncbi:type IV secretory system conjugative DNA transfer family protein [Henriciella sp.]|uniref:type IV secretory system conjugative DNA transfer family protein n=1 Tax=Henriciella sp. TaxID=1968823 RepID=UPI0025C4BF9F|nr:type IV secretory system conjugative DNA transfer family protein [Henriciella sp.]
MPSKEEKKEPHPLTTILCFAGLVYISVLAYPMRYDPDFYFIPYCLWLGTAFIGLEILGKILKYALRFRRQIQVRKAKGNKGTAHWAGARLIRRLSKRKTGLFCGVSHGKGVFLPFETSAMVLAGSGAGKTVGTVIPELLHNPLGMLVTDLKGSLACITARHRRKNKTYFLNPGELFKDSLGPSARFNPLTSLIKNWSEPTRHKHLVADAKKLALQLVKEPAAPGENSFFREGSRKLLVFSMLYLVTQFGTVTLSQTLSLLRDIDRLEAAFYAAQATSVLSGDLSGMAKDLTRKIENGDSRQFESFREGALQVLEPYSASGVLAAATEHSDFDMEELKTGKVTVYIICDPTQQDTFAEWIALVTEAASSELIRSADRTPVVFLLDEATNFKIASLPKLLTSVREFGIRIIVVLQELEQWAHVYGRESLETLLSQTELKIFHGTGSQKARELISKMLGSSSLREESYSTGRNLFSPVSSTVSEVAKPILTPEQVGQFSRSIVFYRNNPPMQLDKVGYHEVTPWRSQAQANPYFGKKKYKGRVKLRL